LSMPAPVSNAAGGRNSSHGSAGQQQQPAAGAGANEQSLKLLDSIRMLGSLGALPSGLLGSLGNASGTGSVEWLLQMLNSTQQNSAKATNQAQADVGVQGAAAASAPAGGSQQQQGGGKRGNVKQEGQQGGASPTVSQKSAALSADEMPPPDRPRARDQSQQQQLRSRQQQTPPPTPASAQTAGPSGPGEDMSAFASSQGLAAALAAAAAAAAAAAGTPPGTPAGGVPLGTGLGGGSTTNTGGTGNSTSTGTTDSGSGFAKFLVDLLSLKQSNSAGAGALPNLEAAAAAAAGHDQGVQGSLADSLAAVQSYLSNITKQSDREGHQSRDQGPGANRMQPLQQRQGAGGAQHQGWREAPKRSGSRLAMGPPAGGSGAGAAAAAAAGGGGEDGPFDQLLLEAEEQARAAKRRRTSGSPGEGNASASASSQEQLLRQHVLQSLSAVSMDAAAGDAALIPRDCRGSSDTHVKLQQAGSSAVHGAMGPPASGGSGAGAAGKGGQGGSGRQGTP
jgi:hypothetical protein